MASRKVTEMRESGMVASMAEKQYEPIDQGPSVLPAAPPPTARAFGSAAADLAEALIRALGSSKRLDAIGQGLGAAFSRVVRQGRLKDALSGTWSGHPAHPMLTDVTIGSWTSALVLDLLGIKDGAEVLVGVGVLAALPTAVTGLSDLADLGTEHERSVGAAHAIGNLTATGLYAASYVARRFGSREVGVTLSLAGAAVMTASAFLGGHLSFRRGIGVDHTAFEYPVEEWTAVLDDGDLREGEPCLVHAEGNDVLLYRIAGGAILALADHCTHAGGPLHEGSFAEGRVTCPWHASVFNLADGSVARGPATAPEPCFQTRVRGGRIEIRSQI